MNLLKYFVFLAIAQSNAVDEKSLLKAYPLNPMLNEVVAFEAVPNHHFNLKSKTNCGNGRLIDETEQKVQCQMWAPGTSELQLYVCDDAKTFCRREVLSLTTQAPVGLGGWLNYYKSHLFRHGDWSTPFKSGVSYNTAARGFILNDLQKGLEQARKEKKKLFLYVTQISCPPCRLLKEMTFATDAFQEIMKEGYVPVQVDLDIDVDPEKMKPLKIKGTPTILVMDGDFKELGRATRVMSPDSVKAFLTSVGASPIGSFKASEEPAWEAEFDKITSRSQAIDFLKNIKTENFNFNEGEWISYTAAFIGPVNAMNLPAEQALFSKAMSLLGALETKVKAAPVDELQRAYNLNTYYEILAYIYKKKKRPADQKAFDDKNLSVLNSFPKLPGVTETTQLTVMKAEASQNPMQIKLVYDDLRSKNKNDYSYDFWEASQAMQKGDLPSALVLVDKSLAIAKDRSWQKAFMMKVDILTHMGRKSEALKLINDLLVEIRLPSDSTLKIHSFVQELRRAQAELGDTKKI